MNHSNRAAVLAALGVFALSACTTVPTQGARTQAYVPAGDVQALPRDAKSFVLPEGAGSSSILTCASSKLVYTPLPALPAFGYTDIRIDKTTHKPTTQTLSWPDKPQEVNALLTNISTQVTENALDVSGKLPIFSASHEHKQYVIDFMKWRAEPLYGDNGNQYGWARVGAGMRVVIDIRKDNGDANGSLLGMLASVKAGKIAGSISTELIGMDAKEVTQAMPFTVDLSDGNIQRVVEALAVVKTKLYDDGTRVAPNLIARIQCAPTSAQAAR